MYVQAVYTTSNYFKLMMKLLYIDFYEQNYNLYRHSLPNCNQMTIFKNPSMHNQILRTIFIKSNTKNYFQYNNINYRIA